jgi:hypothetical protein
MFPVLVLETHDCTALLFISSVVKITAVWRVYTQSAPSLSFVYSLQRDREPYRQKREKVERDKKRGEEEAKEPLIEKKVRKIRANSSSFRSDQPISPGFVVIGDLLPWESSISFGIPGLLFLWLRFVVRFP